MPAGSSRFKTAPSVGVLSLSFFNSAASSNFLVEFKLLNQPLDLLGADVSRDHQPGNPRRSQTNDWLPERFAVLILDLQQSAAPGVQLDVQLDKEGR